MSALEKIEAVRDRLQQEGSATAFNTLSSMSSILTEALAELRAANAGEAALLTRINEWFDDFDDDIQDAPREELDETLLLMRDIRAALRAKVSA